LRRWLKRSSLYRVEVRQGDSGGWYTRTVYVENGKTWQHSETYDTGREYAIERAKKFADDCGLRLDVIDEPALTPVAAPFLPEGSMAGPA
jgi:hypothetical protein